MDIRKLCNILTIIDYAVFVLATIFVLIFQFTGLPIFVTLSLVIYTIGFLLVASVAVFKIYDAYFNKIDAAKIKDDDKRQAEIERISKERNMEIVKLCLSAVFAIFTFVVLILY